jgi:Flp pilus assembly protein TadB
LSGLVIALAPLVFGIFAMVTDSRTAGFLLRSRVGLVCLALGLALDAIAAWWMQRITAGVVA